MRDTVHLILGATGGIGSAVARSLAAAGAKPVLAARGEEKLAALGAELDAPTRALAAAATCASAGIRVNVVSPGLTRTPLVARVTENDAARQASEAMHALGRIGEPEDVASAILWFLSRAQSWVTGQVLGVDGGLASVRPARG